MKTNKTLSKFLLDNENFNYFFKNEGQIKYKLIKLLLKKKVHIGRKVQNWNPKISPFISGRRSGDHIFNLEKTLNGLTTAIKLIKNITAQGGTVLFVNTDPDLNRVISAIIPKNEQIAIVSIRWVGGTLTNWNSFKNFFNKFYQSDEISVTKSQVRRFVRDFKDLELCKKQPDLVVFFNSNEHIIGIQEATKKCVPIVAITDADSNPQKINYIIPGNLDSFQTQFLFFQLLILSAIKGFIFFKTKTKNSLWNVIVHDLILKKRFKPRLMYKGIQNFLNLKQKNEKFFKYLNLLFLMKVLCQKYHIFLENIEEQNKH